MKIKRVALLVALATILGCTLWTNKIDKGAFLEVPIAVYYLYDGACASCENEQWIYTLASEKLVPLLEEYPYEIYPCNTFTIDGLAYAKQIAAEFNVDYATLSIPCVIMNGNVLKGEAMITSRIAEQLKVAHEEKVNLIDVSLENALSEDTIFDTLPIDPTFNNVLYFYRLECAECVSVNDCIDQLPQSCIINGQNVQTNLIKLNTRSLKNGEKIQALFSIYNVPEEEQVVPIVFFADGYLSGAENIREYLVQYWEQGKGLGMNLIQ